LLAGVATSQQVGSSSGRCPLHRDYDSEVETPTTRSRTFYLHLQNVDSRSGPTFVFPYSRRLAARPRPRPSISKREGPGRPPACATRARRPATRAARVAGPSEHRQLDPRSLERELTKLIAPVVLVGPVGSVFCHESGDWHGARGNTSTRPRAELMWSYSTPDLVGRYQIEDIS